MCGSAAVLPTCQLGPAATGPAFSMSHLLITNHPDGGEVAPPQLVQHGVAPVLEFFPHPHAVVAACMGATGQGGVGVRRLAVVTGAAVTQAGMNVSCGRATGRGGARGGRLPLLRPLIDMSLQRDRHDRGCRPGHKQQGPPAAARRRSPRR